MSKNKTMHIRCADVIGYRAAQHPDAAEQLAHVVATHLPGASRLVLNLGGIPSYSPFFIRAFWNGLARTMTPQEIRERLHLRTASHTLREAFEHGLAHISRRSACPHFQTPSMENSLGLQQA